MGDRNQDPAWSLDDALGVVDLVNDQRYQIEVRDQVLLAIRNLLGEDGHRVALDALPALVAERLGLLPAPIAHIEIPREEIEKE